VHAILLRWNYSAPSNYTRNCVIVVDFKAPLDGQGRRWVNKTVRERKKKRSQQEIQIGVHVGQSYLNRAKVQPASFSSVMCFLFFELFHSILSLYL
jgi:hypothetical protein